MRAGQQSRFGSLKHCQQKMFQRRRRMELLVASVENTPLAARELPISTFRFSRLELISSPSFGKLIRMSKDLKPLVIAISTRGLFDLEKAHEIYEEEGLDAFFEYERAHEDEDLRPGA